MTGCVFLVGAGPGDPGLITRRGLDLLRSCDVVLYDRLVPVELLDETPAHAERIFVGKKPGEPHSRQVVADALLIARAREGKRVVRLKGGDPFVFGRGGEELEVLASANIAFEVVPGVTSATAVPAYAGIPVTHRGAAASVAFLTGYEAPDEPGGPPRLSRAGANADTLVLLMGVSALRATALKLIEAGRSPQEPAAVIEWGTTTRQRTVVGDLASIADVAEGADIKPPATVVVGDVVKLRETLEWFESRPLFGRRIVVTRPRSQASEFSARLRGLGAEVLELPTIEIANPPSWDELDWAIRKLAEGFYSWCIFASTNAVQKFFYRLSEAGRDARSFGRTKIAAVGRVTAESLETFGLRADVVPDRFTARAVADALGHGGSGHVLLPRAADAPQDAAGILSTHGWIPEEVTAYVTVPATPGPAAVEAVAAGSFDVVTFASASSVRNFVEIVGKPADLGLDSTSETNKRVLCIGPATAETAKDLGFRVDAVPNDHTSEGLVSALVTRAGG